MLGEALRATDHLLERAADDAGDVIRSRKGDFVVTLDPEAARGSTLRIVVECKDRRISGRAMREELAEARRNRDACVGLVVFSAAHAPSGIAPFDIRLGDVYCVIDPAAPDQAISTRRCASRACWRSRRCASERAEMDAAAVRDALERIRAQLDSVRALKVQLTTIGSAAREVSSGLDRLRESVVAHIADAEAGLTLRV